MQTLKKKLKIAKLGLGEKVVELRDKGMSTRDIANFLRNEYHVEVNYVDVHRYLDRVKTDSVEVSQHLKEFQDEASKRVMNMLKEMEKVYKETWKLLDEVKQEGLTTARVAVLRELREQIEALHRLVGRVMPTIKANTVNIAQISYDIDKVITIMEKKGYKIIPPKGKE